MLIINLIAVLVIKIKGYWNRKVFFAVFAVDVVLAGVAMVVALGGIGESNSCANNHVVHRFVGFQTLITMIVSAMVLFGPFETVVRWANAPGNLVWCFLFFGVQLGEGWTGSYVTVGIIYLLISIGSFVAHLITVQNGMS